MRESNFWEGCRELIDYLVADSSVALVLYNDSKKKISLFEKASPWDPEGKRENENKKDKKKDKRQ